MDDKKLRQEALAILYQQSIYIIPVNLLISTLILIWTIILNVPMLLVMSWWGAILLSSVIRFIYVLHALKVKKWETQYTAKRNLFTLGALITGSLWGASYLLFAPYLSPLHQVFLILALGSMAAGALSPMASYVIAYLCFIIPTLLPTIIVHLIRWNTDSIILAAIFGFYLCALIVISINSNKKFKDNILLRLNEEKFASSLKIKNNELAIAYAKIEAVSLTDKLTNISNRRFLEIMMEKSWSIAQRAKLLVAILMIDIDFFKQYNDTYGHLAGDECLVKIATVIHTLSRRHSDICARYGGDEFIIVLFDTTTDNTMNLANQTKEAVYDLQIPNAGSTAFPCVTISIGLALMIPADNQDYHQLIAAADKALYQAKKLGKNTISMLNL